MLIIGHRGAGGYEPENTIRSFRAALERGAGMIELDVRRSADGELVVFHDETLERVTNGTGFLAETSFEDLRKLDAGKGERIPALREAFEAIGRAVPVNIEIKSGDAAAPVAAFLKELVAGGRSYDDFLLSSFDHLELWRLKELDGKLRVAPLIAAPVPEFAAFAKELGAFSVHAAFPDLTAAFVDDIHRKELKLYAYTVNTPEEASRAASLGLDGIFSDFPDRVRI